MIGVGSMMGIPLMSGFASKWMLYAAALQAGWAVPAMVAWAVSLGTVFLGAKATSAVFLGPLTATTKDAHESPPTMVWGMGLHGRGQRRSGHRPAVGRQLPSQSNPCCTFAWSGFQVTWFGLFADAGSFSTTGGLVLAVVSLVLGGVIYALAYYARPVAVASIPGRVAGGAILAGAGGEIFTGGEPLSDRPRLTASDFSEIFAQNWRGFFRWSNVDRVYLGAWQGLQTASSVLGAGVLWMEENAAVLLVAIAAALLACVRWFVPGAANVEAHTVVPVPALVAACSVAASALILAALAQSTWRRLTPLMILAGASAVVGLIVSDSWLRLGFLESGALLTIPLVWKNARMRPAKLAYVAAVIISAVSLALSELMIARGETDWAPALLVTSVCVKLAAVPLFFWLLRLADELPALLLGLIIAVVDIAAFGELYVIAQTSAALLKPQGLWLAIAALTSLIAALLMLSQRSLKRLLVLSTVEDVGFLLLGLGCASALGANGALTAAATHALAKALLFACLSAPEAGGALDGHQTGLAIRYPLSAFGFLFGMLAMLGVPPTLGYIGRWRLYEAALQIGPLLLTAFILSSVFALIAYVLALTHIWWGPANGPDSSLQNPPASNRQMPKSPTREPLMLQATIVALVVLLLVAGMWPQVMHMLPGGGP